MRRLFEPLGYGVHAVDHLLDEEFPEWGESGYFIVELEGEPRRACALCRRELPSGDQRGSPEEAPENSCSTWLPSG